MSRHYYVYTALNVSFYSLQSQPTFLLSPAIHLYQARAKKMKGIHPMGLTYSDSLAEQRSP